MLPSVVGMGPKLAGLSLWALEKVRLLDLLCIRDRTAIPLVPLGCCSTPIPGIMDQSSIMGRTPSLRGAKGKKVQIGKNILC